MKNLLILLSFIVGAFGRPNYPYGLRYRIPENYRSKIKNVEVLQSQLYKIPESIPYNMVHNNNGPFSSPARYPPSSDQTNSAVSATTRVFKHVYVHVAPEEEVEDERQVPVIPVRQPQKHYKIIFIKAPSPTPAAPIIPIQPQSEEKTLVYVLVKKPDDPEDIVIPSPVPTKPSKPEVYFIKYQSTKGTNINLGSGTDNNLDPESVVINANTANVSRETPIEQQTFSTDVAKSDLTSRYRGTTF